MVDVAQHHVVVVEDDEPCVLREREGSELRERPPRPFARPRGHDYRRHCAADNGGEGEGRQQSRLDLLPPLAARENVDGEGRVHDG